MSDINNQNLENINEVIDTSSLSNIIRPNTYVYSPSSSDNELFVNLKIRVDTITENIDVVDNLTFDGEKPELKVIENIDKDGVLTISINNKEDYNLIEGDYGRDILYGKNGKNIILAHQGDDIIIGGNNIDNIYGGKGDDYIKAKSGDDFIDAGRGDDIIEAASGNDLIKAGEGDDFIDAGSENDVIYAGSGEDILHGGSGDDVLKGEAGNDIIYAGEGADIIVTGSGEDIVKYFSIDDSSSNQYDIITDFSQNADIIDLSELNRYAIEGFSDLSIEQTQGNTIISVDYNDFKIELSGEIYLTEDDFIF